MNPNWPRIDHKLTKISRFRVILKKIARFWLSTYFWKGFKTSQLSHKKADSEPRKGWFFGGKRILRSPLGPFWERNIAALCTFWSANFGFCDNFWENNMISKFQKISRFGTIDFKKKPKNLLIWVQKPVFERSKS